MSNTPQVGEIEGNAADDALMVDQGQPGPLDGSNGAAADTRRKGQPYFY